MPTLYCSGIPLKFICVRLSINMGCFKTSISFLHIRITKLVCYRSCLIVTINLQLPYQDGSDRLGTHQLFMKTSDGIGFSQFLNTFLYQSTVNHVTVWGTVLLEKPVKNLPHIREPEVSLWCSQEPTTYPCPEPEKLFHTLPSIHFLYNLILLSHLHFGLFPADSPPPKPPDTILSFPKYTTPISVNISIQNLNPLKPNNI